MMLMMLRLIYRDVRGDSLLYLIIDQAEMIVLGCQNNRGRSRLGIEVVSEGRQCRRVTLRSTAAYAIVQWITPAETARLKEFEFRS